MPKILEPIASNLIFPQKAGRSTTLTILIRTQQGAKKLCFGWRRAFISAINCFPFFITRFSATGHGGTYLANPRRACIPTFP